jgi:NTP pyrophosphatase (non-canonical NTP hydrolase)
MATSAPPDPMTLTALQRYVARTVEERGFTREPNEIFILLVEEVGELASEFKHWIYYPERFDRENLGFELADILLYLLDLANAFSVELMALWPEHERSNDERFAPRRAAGAPRSLVQPDLTLNGLVDHVEAKRRERNFADTAERLMILLTEEVGEIATELRKQWKGKGDPRRTGMEIIDALTYLFRLAHQCQVDLEAAVLNKERENARRVWSY